MQRGLALAGGGLAVAGAAYVFFKPKAKIGDCCPGQSHGYLPESPDYVPRGKMEEVGGTPMYVVGDSTKAVVLVHDVFGLHTGRHKQLADEVASWGYLVVMPDFFNHCKLPGGMWGKVEYGYGLFDPSQNMSATLKCAWALLGGGMKAYMAETPGAMCCSLYNDILVPYLKGRGVLQTGAIGFCWGAYCSYHLAAHGDGAMKLVANVAIHPSVDTVAAIHKENESCLVRAASGTPTLVFASKLEPASWQPGGEMQQLMEAEAEVLGKSPKKQIGWRHVDQMHGFVTRGGMRGDLKLAQDVQAVMEETRAFFARKF
mmetsp:Transcript_22885/g.71288  ORF Transcript_22885/g.71288 Transcript_22885/m.71288 type:complete len:315 (+) Transcript_22885:117-1061(+)